MKEFKEITIKDEKKDNKNGYQIIIKNLDNGEEVINVKTRAIIGAYATELGLGDVLSSSGICLTSCNSATLLATIKGAEKVAEQIKNKMFEEIMPDLLKELLRLEIEK